MEQLQIGSTPKKTDPEMATKMLNEGFLAALRMKFELFSVGALKPN